MQIYIPSEYSVASNIRLNIKNTSVAVNGNYEAPYRNRFVCPRLSDYPFDVQKICYNVQNTERMFYVVKKIHVCKELLSLGNDKLYVFLYYVVLCIPC